MSIEKEHKAVINGYSVLKKEMSIDDKSQVIELLRKYRRGLEAKTAKDESTENVNELCDFLNLEIAIRGLL